MIIAQITLLIIALVTVGFVTSGILQLFTHKSFINSKKGFKARLQRKTRFGSRALVVGGYPLGLILCVAFLIDWSVNPDQRSSHIFTFLVLLSVGFLDDLFELRSLVKLACQVFAMSFWAYSLYDTGSSFIFCMGFLFLGLVITNSVNLLDGIDTQSTRLSQVGLIYYGLILLSAGLVTESIYALSLFVSLSAFSRFNRGLYPLYLGEMGVNVISMSYLYFSWRILEVTSLTSGIHSAFFVASVPLIFYVSEVIVSFSRRVLAGRSPFAKDQLHFHHILTQKLGFSPYKSGHMMGILSFCTILISCVGSFVLGLNSYLSLILALGGNIALQVHFASPYWSVSDSLPNLSHLLFRRGHGHGLGQDEIAGGNVLNFPANSTAQVSVNESEVVIDNPAEKVGKRIVSWASSPP